MGLLLLLGIRFASFWHAALEEWLSLRLVDQLVIFRLVHRLLVDEWLTWRLGRM